MAKHGIDALPREMQQKMDRILAMDLDQLNDAYIREMERLGLKILNYNQPTLDEIWKVLIPELFELAAERKRQRAH